VADSINPQPRAKSLGPNTPAWISGSEAMIEMGERMLKGAGADTARSNLKRGTQWPLDDGG